MTDWTTADIPSLSGRITGGLGYETALVLAGAGAEVVLTNSRTPKSAMRTSILRVSPRWLNSPRASVLPMFRSISWSTMPADGAAGAADHRRWF
jgi:hypothetical protein